jgi:hypothetical protein
MEKFNVDLLKNKSTAKQYAEQVAKLLGQSPIVINDTSDLNDDWKSLKICITSAADKVIGKAPQERKKAWFDKECQEATRKKNEVYREIQQRQTRARVKEYWHLRRAEKRIHQRKKRAFYNEEIKKLETARREKAADYYIKRLKTQGRTLSQG